jgi:hypothetical protein
MWALFVVIVPPSGNRRAGVDEGKSSVKAALQVAVRETMMSPLIGKSMGTHDDDHGTFGPRTSATLERG